MANYMLTYKHSRLLPKVLMAVGLCMCFSLTLQAQTAIPDRIKQYEREIAEGKVDDVKILKNYIDLITLYSPIDIEKTHYYFRKAVAYAQEKEQLDWESAYWRRMSSVYYEMGNIDSSYYCIDKAIELVEGKGYDYEQCANYQIRGTAFFMGHEYEKSLDAYLKALELNEKDRAQKIAKQENIHNNFGIEASIYRFISMIYSKLLNHEKAIDYLLRAKKIVEDNPADRASFVLFEIELLGELVEVYMATGQSEKALPLLNRCYDLAVSRQFLPEMVFGLCRLSNFYRVEHKDYNQALSLVKEALQIAEKTRMPYLVSYAERNMMNVYFGLKDYQSAYKYAERALLKADEGDWAHLQDIYGNLIMIHAVMGNVSQSEVYLKKYNEITAKISDKAMHSALQEMEVKYNVQQKQLEIERQQSKIRSQRIRLLIFAGGLIMSFLLLAMLVYIVVLRNRRNRQLSEINAIKDKFFSIISHDLKNPVFAQREALQTLVDYAPQMKADVLSDLLHTLLKTANSLAELLKNLLDWAGMQTGRDMFYAVPFNLVGALQPDIELVKGLAERKNIAFELILPPAALITADANMLVTVVRNLLTNAVKFTAAGGKVLLQISENNGKYSVSVSDTGIGMAQEQLQNLFRIDRQHLRKGTAGEQSSGLGLIVCREMLQKHGCVLYVESEEGKGSRFWFDI
jgi:Signal transduction histidine kinase